MLILVSLIAEDPHFHPKPLKYLATRADPLALEAAAVAGSVAQAAVHTADMDTHTEPVVAAAAADAAAAAVEEVVLVREPEIAVLLAGSWLQLPGTIAPMPPNWLVAAVVDR